MLRRYVVAMTPKDKIIELQDNGFCVLKSHFPSELVGACRAAFCPILLDFLKSHCEEPNRGPHRHFLPMPFQPPCFAPEFFCDAEVLSIVRGAMDERIVADQWGCDGQSVDRPTRPSTLIISAHCSPRSLTSCCPCIC